MVFGESGDLSTFGSVLDVMNQATDDGPLA
jgi:hypothetical protein